MPQFHLNTPPTAQERAYANHYRRLEGKPPLKTHPCYALDEFTQGYIEAMFFTNCDSGDDKDEWKANNLGVERLTHKSVARIKADCEAFQKAAAPLLEIACGPMSGYSEEQAGRDFWFTRQGHGVGFWDREELRRDIAKREDGTFTDDGETEGLPFLGSLGDLLREYAQEAGEVWPEIYRGWIYYG